jgi:hypothetical protein
MRVMLNAGAADLGPPASSFMGSRRWQLQEPGDAAPRNVPGRFNKVPYSAHAFDQMQNRGIPPNVADQAIRTGTISPGREPGTIYVYDSVNDVTIVRNSVTGRIITIKYGEP